MPSGKGSHGVMLAGFVDWGLRQHPGNWTEEFPLLETPCLTSAKRSVTILKRVSC